MSRSATIQRKTAETDIELTLELDGSGIASVSTGVGFLDHMLTLLTRHGAFDLSVRATGDLHIDDHHTVEDVGICLGLAIQQAVGDKRGICRYGAMTLPMDETLVTTALDLSGRPAFVWNVQIPTEKIGTFDSQLAAEFWNAVSSNGRMNFHALLHYGANSHHIVEAVFKAAGRSLRAAVSRDPRMGDQLPSTKESL
ncbi:MAG: imidazoleglycerol-phosphate dehydratase HisB [Planctomycetales bacterium]|nr:imidazoleglycerol-phosphate dehydratase HisB [Planctomycetales bacterium]